MERPHLPAPVWGARYGRVLDDLRGALAWAKQKGEDRALSIRLTVSGLCDQARGLIEELENLSVDYNTSVRGQVLNAVERFLLSYVGQSEAAIQHLQQCLAMLPPPKISVVRIDALQALAEAQRACGEVREALTSIDEAIDLSTDTHAAYNFPNLLRTKADVLISIPHVGMEEIQEVLSDALDRARKEGSLSWELRISLTLAKARASQGRSREARELIEHVYSRFTEGFDTNDLKAAAQVLQGT